MAPIVAKRDLLGRGPKASQDETAGYTAMGVIVLADEDDRAIVLPC